MGQCLNPNDFYVPPVGLSHTRSDAYIRTGLENMSLLGTEWPSSMSSKEAGKTKQIVSGYEQGCTLDCTYTVVDVGA